MSQQNVESINLKGNALGDVGIVRLCESLEKQLSLDVSLSSVSRLTELILRCSNMTCEGLKKLEKAAAIGSFKVSLLGITKKKTPGDFVLMARRRVCVILFLTPPHCTNPLLVVPSRAALHTNIT